MNKTKLNHVSNIFKKGYNKFTLLIEGFIEKSIIISLLVILVIYVFFHKNVYFSFNFLS